MRKVTCAADHGLKWSNLTQDYVRHDNQWPEARDGDFGTNSTINIAPATNNRYGFCYFHSAERGHVAKSAYIDLYTSSADTAEVRVKNNGATISDTYTVPDTRTLMHIPLNSSADMTDGLQIEIEATGSSTLYVYESGFEISGGASAILVI